MNSYITRVELHGGTEADYQVLHTQMALKGFSHTVVADDGTTYNLPTAMYRIDSALSAPQVRELAQSAANVTGKISWVITIKSAGMSWSLRFAS
jgi:hypothetical protein